MQMRGIRRVAIMSAVAGAIGAAVGVHWWRTHSIGPVERGGRVAAANGCFVCHGAPGQRVDLDRGLGGAPPFTLDEVKSRARTEGEIREWILDGEPSRLREQPDANVDPAIIRMPSFRRYLSNGEATDLVALVKASSDFDELPPAAAGGRALAGRLGCFGCHGPGGKGDTPNSGSLKGYIPSWTGSDFDELVRDSRELREWIHDGTPERLRKNPVARFFLERQTVRMPAYGDRVTAEEIDAIESYIRSLRSARPPS